MKTIIITFIIILSVNHLFSQKDTSQFYNKTLSNNNFSIELGGKALLYSVGYERIVYRSKKVLLTGNFNLSYAPFAGFNGIIVPIGINTLIGEKRNKLLFGLSATNGFNFFNIYPKTRKERELKRISGGYYLPIYVLTFIQLSAGYRMYLKNGNSLSFVFTPILPLGIDEAGGGYSFDPKAIVPWFGITYNLKL